MDQKWRRFAPIGLYFALTALLVSVGIYVVMREWNLTLQISLGLVVLGLAFFVLFDPDRVRVALTGRQAKYGSNAVLVLLAFMGILAVVNYLVQDNNKRIDMTEDKQHTLAKETLDTLSKLEETVVVNAFYTSRTSSDQAQNLLKRYAENSDGKFIYEFINPEADPVAAQKANVTRDGTIVMQMGTKTEQITYADEQRLTAGLVRLLSTGKKVIYFLTGHGEKSPDGTDDTSFSSLKLKLQAKNFEIKSLNLLMTEKIPDDANVIVVADPKQPLLEGEVDRLGEFTVNGGALVVLLEPTIITDYGDSPDLLARYLDETWGVTVGNDIIVDLVGQQYVNEPFMAVAGDYAVHPIITEELQNVATFFRQARSVSANTEKEGFTYEEIVRTSENAWAETDLEAIRSNTDIAPDEGIDIMGPVPLMVTAENTATKGRVLVAGDSDFPTNVFENVMGDQALAINMIDWAAGQENLINLTPKTSTDRTLTIQPTLYTRGGILLVTVILIPGIVLVVGIVVLILRRRRG